MYLLFEPRQISSLKARIDHIPRDIANFFVMGRHCSSSDDIVALNVSLIEPAGIVGPKAATEPRSLPMRNVVAQFISLGQTDHITIYIPSGTIDERRRLLELPTVFREWSRPCDSVVSTLYAGKGGRMLHSMADLCGPFGRASEQDTLPLDAPPAYHRVTSESSQALISKRRQRLRSPSHEQPPRKKQDREHPGKVPLLTLPASDDAWKRAFAEQLAFLTAKVASLEEGRPSTPVQTVDVGVQTDEATYHATNHSANRSSPHPSTCSTVGDSLEDRLMMAERQISAIRGEMIRLRDSFKFSTSKRPESPVPTISQALELKISDILQAYEGLSDEVDELKAGVADEVRDVLDDMLSGMKLEMRDYASDEMEIIERRLFDRVRTVIGRARLSIKLDDDDDTDE